MGPHRNPATRRAANVVSAAMTVGMLLLAGPAAVAFAAPPGNGSGNPGGINDPGGGGPPSNVLETRAGLISRAAPPHPTESAADRSCHAPHRW